MSNSAEKTDINDTLTERGTRYGTFANHAAISQQLKFDMQQTPNWYDLPADMKEALEMTAHKIARILNGDPNYDDSWRDIIGYNQLILNRLTGEGPK